MKSLNRLALAALAFVAATQVASAFYDPSVGRWINRDPLGERGFGAVSRVAAPAAPDETGAPAARWYGAGRSALLGEASAFLFVGNAPLSSIDPLGLFWGCSQDPCCIVCWKVQHGYPTGGGGCLYSVDKLDLMKPLGSGSGCCPSATPTAIYVYTTTPCEQPTADDGGQICIKMYSAKDRPDGKGRDGKWK
jgi:hypothetical protein